METGTKGWAASTLERWGHQHTGVAGPGKLVPRFLGALPEESAAPPGATHHHQLCLITATRQGECGYPGHRKGRDTQDFGAILGFPTFSTCDASTSPSPILRSSYVRLEPSLLCIPTHSARAPVALTWGLSPHWCPGSWSNLVT